MTGSFCGDASLEVLLDEQTEHPQYDAMVAHLNECRACQQQLDHLAARPSVWEDVQRFLYQPDPDEIPDLAAGETLVAATLETLPLPGLSELRAWLDSPQHPEMLGRVGKYEIESEIGRGGMGIVLKGFDSELNRPVAVKLLAPHLASSGTARQRFVREARAAAAVVHENVVAIHSIETDGALPSIVMPLISGCSLQQHVELRGPLEPLDVVRIGIQVAAGLAAAHDQGLVHRDIKPANILLENGINRVQITDFGLARAAHEVDITRTGMIAGTPAFMSPEQSLSESIDARSDLFSLGALLYYAATGRLPFRASTPIGVLQQVCNALPTRPSEIDPRIPRPLEACIDKLLAKSPDDRFVSASAVRAWLTEYLAHMQQPQTVPAPKRLPAPRAVRRQRRRRIVVVALGLAALGMTMLFVTQTELGIPTAPQENRATMMLSESSSVSDVTSMAAVLPAPEALDAEIRALGLVAAQLETPISEGKPQESGAFGKDLTELRSELQSVEQSTVWGRQSVRAPGASDNELKRLDSSAVNVSN